MGHDRYATIFGGSALARLDKMRRQIAEDLRAARLKAGFSSQRALANAAGIPRPQITRLENRQDLHRLRLYEQPLAAAVGPQVHRWIAKLEALELQAEALYCGVAKRAFLAWSEYYTARAHANPSAPIPEPTLEDAQEVGRRVLARQFRKASGRAPKPGEAGEVSPEDTAEILSLLRGQRRAVRRRT